MMNKYDDVLWLDATGQADLIRRKAIKPEELVEAAIERIERLNPELNAIITPLFDQARQLASGPIPAGPFRGVPFLMKDIGASLAKVPMSLGTALLKNFVPDHDSELTLRFKKASVTRWKK